MIGRVLVTGATGFVGSHLVRRLLGGGSDVHIVTRPGSSLALIGEVAPHVSVHTHDGSTQGMIDIVSRARPDVVFHLASRFLAAHRSADVVGLIESNVLFGTQLLEAMAASGAVNLVNTGTSWQHFETDGYRPVSLYAATKQAFEDLLLFYVDATPVRAVSLHLFDTYGSGDPRPKLLHLLAKAAESGEELAMSPGEQQLDLVHVDDVVDAFLAAGHHLIDGVIGQGEVFAVSAGRTMTLRELVGIFERVRGRPLNVVWGGRPYRAREVMSPWNAGRPVPGWGPRVTVEEGIRRLLDGR